MAERRMQIVDYDPNLTRSGLAWLAMRTQFWVTQLVRGRSLLYTCSDVEAVVTVALTNQILAFCQDPVTAIPFLLDPARSKLKTSSIRSMVWNRFAFYYTMLGDALEACRLTGLSWEYYERSSTEED